MTFSAAACRAWFKTEMAKPTSVTLLAGMLAFAGFYFIDPTMTPNAIKQHDAAVARLIMVGVLAFEWVLYKRLPEREWSVCVAVLTICIGVSWINAIVTENGNGYHDSIVLAMMAFAAGGPVTMLGVSVVFGLVLVVHIGLLLGYHGISGLLVAANQVGVLALSTGVALGVFRVISAYREQHADDMDHLRQVYADKDALFANVNHELRTPLAIIVDYMEGLRDFLERLGSVPQNYHIARRSAERLGAMINTILQMTRLDAPRAKLTLSRWSMTELIRECVGDLAPLAARNGVTLQFLGGEGNIVVEADYDAIERVVVNLLTNAMKFTERGGRIVVTAVIEGALVKVNVEDTGKGIPEAERGRIFERLYQGELGKSVSQAGIGLGLSMCETIMTKHAGRIYIGKTEVGKGTTMTFELPLSTANTAAMAKASQDAERPSMDWTNHAGTNSYRLAEFEEASERREVPRLAGDKRKPLLLIVEDNRDFRDRIVVLMGDDCDCAVAKDGFEGLAKARTEQPAIIVSDVNMPNMDGMTMVSHFKQDPNLMGIPIIIMTAGHSSEGRQQSHAYDADEYIDKADFRRELPPAIAKHLRKQKANTEEAAAQIQLERRIVVNGLLHNIRNPVFYISDAIGHIESDVTPIVVRAQTDGLASAEMVEDYRENMRALNEGVVNIKDLLDDLEIVAAGKEDTIAPPLILVTPLLQRSLSVLAATHKSIKRSFASKRLVSIRRGQFVSVVVNLIRNASQAGGENCKIEVRTFDDLDRKAVVIEVADSGPGIAEDVLPRIFEARFTTKKTGSGLGLAMSRDILAQHNGTLTVASALGHGSTFTITLPFATDA